MTVQMSAVHTFAMSAETAHIGASLTEEIKGGIGTLSPFPGFAGETVVCPGVTENNDFWKIMGFPVVLEQISVFAVGHGTVEGGITAADTAIGSVTQVYGKAGDSISHG